MAISGTRGFGSRAKQRLQSAWLTHGFTLQTNFTGSTGWRHAGVGIFNPPIHSRSSTAWTRRPFPGWRRFLLRNRAHSRSDIARSANEVGSRRCSMFVIKPG